MVLCWRINLKAFVGVDNIPMTHGMTAGELAQFFNRNIMSKLTVVPMEGYNRAMAISRYWIKLGTKFSLYT